MAREAANKNNSPSEAYPQGQRDEVDKAAKELRYFLKRSSKALRASFGRPGLGAAGTFAA